MSKQIIIGKISQLLVEQSPKRREDLKVELYHLIVGSKTSFPDVASEVRAKNEFIKDMARFADNPNEVNRSLLSVQLTIFPNIIVE